MLIHNAVLTGSFSYAGADLSNISASADYSASLSTRTTNLETASGSFSTRLTAVSSSQQQISSSLLQVSASYIALSGSYNIFSGSASTRITTVSSSQQDISSSQQQISASLLNVIATGATTGSNSFRANQSITGSLVVSSTITAQTLVVQTVTSSIVYSSGSNNFGNQLANTQTFTGSVNITGSTNITGNINLVSSTGFPTVGLLNRSSDTTLYMVSPSNGFTLTDSSLNTMYNATPTVHNWNIGNSLKMKLDVSGSLGLGVTPSGWISTAKAFQLGNTAALYAPSSEAILSNNVFVDSTDNNKYITTNFASQYRQVNGQHIFYTAASGTAGNTISFTTALTIASTGAATFSGSVTLTSGYIETPWANETRTVWERYTNATYFQRISSNGAARQLRLESNGAYGNASIVLDGQGNTTTSTIITSDNSIFTGAVSLNTGNSLRLYRPDSSFPSTSWYWNIYMDSSNLLSFAVNGGTPKMIINASGNVGIGATSVNNEKLTINQTTGNSSALLVNTVGVTTGQSYGLTVQAGTNGSDRSFAVFNQAGDTEYLKVRGDGYLFSALTYNNQWPGYSANMYVASDGSFGRTTPSSGRYKENIIDWSGNGLDTILALKPKTFKYKKDYCNSPDNIDFLGLIAEEVAEVSPYLAQYENLDRTGLVENVRYDTIVVPLIKAIQELKAELDTAKAEITELKNK